MQRTLSLQKEEETPKTTAIHVPLLFSVVHMTAEYDAHIVADTTLCLPKKRLRKQLIWILQHLLYMHLGCFISRQR